MTNQGQISYLEAYHRLGGWFPAEANPLVAVTHWKATSRLTGVAGEMG